MVGFPQHLSGHVAGSATFLLRPPGPKLTEVWTMRSCGGNKCCVKGEKAALTVSTAPRSLQIAAAQLRVPQQSPGPARPIRKVGAVSGIFHLCLRPARFGPCR